jgi:hypothetical protein
MTARNLKRERSEAEFRAWRDEMRRQIAASGLTAEEWVDQRLDRIYGPQASAGRPVSRESGDRPGRMS